MNRHLRQKTRTASWSRQRRLYLQLASSMVHILEPSLHLEGMEQSLAGLPTLDHLCMAQSLSGQVVSYRIQEARLELEACCQSSLKLESLPLETNPERNPAIDMVRLNLARLASTEIPGRRPSKVTSHTLAFDLEDMELKP